MKHINDIVNEGKKTDLKIWVVEMAPSGTALVAASSKDEAYDVWEAAAKECGYDDGLSDVHELKDDKEYNKDFTVKGEPGLIYWFWV